MRHYTDTQPKPIVEARAKAQQVRKPEDFVSPKSDEQKPIRTDESVAELAHAGHHDDPWPPHPRQTEGSKAIGEPAVEEWTDGDALGNICSIVDTSIAANEHANPSATRLIS